METGLLLMALGATLYVMYWLVHNDGAERIRDQHGLCRMKPPPGDEPTAEELAAARQNKGRRPSRPDPRVQGAEPRAGRPDPRVRAEQAPPGRPDPRIRTEQAPPGRPDPRIRLDQAPPSDGRPVQR